MVDVNVINSDIKCKFASLYSDKLIEDEYMIKVCNTSILDIKSFKERVREKYLHSFLLKALPLLTTQDSCGKDVVSCDITKIYNLK